MTVPSLTEAAGLLSRPETTPQELAEIAAAYPELRPAVAAHPNVYPTLQAWIAQVTPPQPPVAAPVEPPVQSPVGAQPLNASRPPVPVPEPATNPAVLARPRVSRAPWVVASVCVVVALAASAALVLRAPAAPVGDHGFATPEEAVTYVVGRLAAGDAAGAGEAFAVDHMVSGYSYQAQAERQNAIAPNGWLPATSDGFRAIDAGRRRGEVAYELQVFVQHAIAPQYDFTLSVSPADSATIARFESALAPQGLASLSLVRVDAILPPAGSRYATNAAKQVKQYGADEMRETTFLIRTSQGTALGGMQLLRYGNSWYVWDMTSVLSGLDMGGLQPMSEQDYLDNLAKIQAGVNG
jgi:hypothetical protein